MDDRPSRGGTADAAALARDIVSRLSAISASLSSGLERASGPDGTLRTAPAGVPIADFGAPRTVLENGARFVSPHLPGDARLRPLKALLLRFLRIVTRDQTVFNSAVLEALRGTLVAAEGALHEAVARAQALEEGLRLVSEEGGRTRDAMGAVLHETQLRVDGLEKDRDGLVESRSRQAEALRALERQIEERYGEIRLLRLEWASLRAGLQAPARQVAPDSAMPAAPAAGDPLRAGLYVDFEEAFRGSEEEIRHRQESDAVLFRGAPGPVADLGCGRGEFLEALRAAGIPASGCDANAVMVARAREKGLAVERADLLDWLASRPDGSLGGITAYQVVEHLPAGRLFELVELAAAKLAAGGIILLESVNPESAYAMKWFWMDLTHVRPVPAPSLARLLTACGFSDIRIDWRSPVPASEAPPAETAEDPKLGPVVKLLYGPQDYAAIGRK